MSGVDDVGVDRSIGADVASAKFEETRGAEPACELLSGSKRGNGFEIGVRAPNIAEVSTMPDGLASPDPPPSLS